MFFSPFRIDVAEEQLWKGDKLLVLRRKPFAILKYLATNPRRLVTHEELLQHVWGGAVVSESSVRTHLHELRQVLGEGVIETVIGRGYRFTVEPTLTDEVTVEPASDDDHLVVGRDAELAVLDAALERAISGHRQLCFVTGEPGIGKTTLVDTFARRIDAGSTIVVRGQCIEQHGTPEAFLAIIEVLSQLRRSRLGDRALAALVRHAPSFLAQLPHLIPDAQLDDVIRRARGGSEARSVRELIEALEALATTHTIVIVLEDLQWSDVATIDLIALLGQRRELARLLVIGTSRRAEAQTVTHPLNRVMRSLSARSGAVTIPLDRIAADAVQHLLDVRFPGHAFPPALLASIDRITGGTPLFVVSFVDDLVGRGMIAERDGRWELTVSVEEVAAHRPESVRQLIDIQLDRLAPDEVRVLEAASVIGLELPTALVAAALEVSVDEVDEICDSLARRSLFLRRDATEEWPDGTVQARYRVTHGLVQEVSLARLAASRRQRWHRRIAERLEAAYGDRAAEISTVLAAHYDNGGLTARAIHYYQLAAERTTLRFANSDARVLFQRAHDLVLRLPATPERDALELGLLAGKIQSVIRSRGETLRGAAAAFEQMIALARRLGDAPRLAAALANLGLRLTTLAELDRADAVAAEFAEIQRTVALPPEVLAIDTTARAIRTTWRGRLEPARELLERELRDAVAAGIIPGMIGPTDRSSLMLVQLSIVQCLLGHPAAAARAARESVDRALASGDPYTLGHGYCALARLAIFGGSPASEVREPAARVLAVPGAEVWHAQATVLVGYADSLEHPLDRAALDELVRVFHGRIAEMPMGATYLGLLVAYTAINSHDPARAAAVVDEMLAFAKATGEGIVEPELLRLRGQLLGPPAAAELYREAIALADAHHSRMFQLRAATSLADPAAIATARAHLADADGSGAP